MRARAIAAAFLFIPLLASEQGARASEATPSGLSIDMGVDLFHDGTIADLSGQSVHAGGALFGLDVLANFGDFAVGGGVGVAPDILGDARLLLGARAGYQPTRTWTSSPLSTRRRTSWAARTHRPPTSSSAAR